MRRTVIVIEPGSFQSAMSHDIPERLAASLPPGSPFKPIVEFTERTSAGKKDTRAIRRFWRARCIARSAAGDPSPAT